MLSNELRVYSDAYIEFCEQLSAMGIVPSTSLEEFGSTYEVSDISSMNEFVEVMITKEISRDADIQFQISANQSLVEINGEIRELEIASDTRSTNEMWYDNIGTSSPALPQRANYSKYNIINLLVPGDIIYETQGGVAALVGHTAIVQGKYYDTTYSQYYIRTIEANQDGVVYGVIDDDRYDYRGSIFYEVPDASATQVSNSVSFSLAQVGKGYHLSGLLSGAVGTECNYLRTASEWYCSELVWAAYYNQGYGYNIYGSGIPKHVYSPAMVSRSSALLRLEVSYAS